MEETVPKGAMRVRGSGQGGGESVGGDDLHPSVGLAAVGSVKVPRRLKWRLLCNA